MSDLSKFAQYIFHLARQLGFVDFDTATPRTIIDPRLRLKRVLVFLLVSVSSTATSVLFMLILGSNNDSDNYIHSLEAVIKRLEETLVITNVGISIFLLANTVYQICGLLLFASLKVGDSLVKLRARYIMLLIAGAGLLVWYFFSADFDMAKIFYALLTISTSLVIFVVTSHIDISKRD
ncbi:MAG: hypothetical protein RLZZ345_664 [Actinomycetota bacterium]|jgi:hypothetical protein